MIGGLNYDFCCIYICLNINDFCGDDVDDDVVDDDEEEEEEVIDEGGDEDEVIDDFLYGMVCLVGMVYILEGESLMDMEV